MSNESFIVSLIVSFMVDDLNVESPIEVSVGKTVLSVIWMATQSFSLLSSCTYAWIVAMVAFVGINLKKKSGMKEQKNEIIISTQKLERSF